MSADTDTLVLEHVRHIRRVVDETRADISDLKVRSTSVEAAIGGLQTQVAAQSGRTHRLDARVERIEQRLNLNGSRSL